MLRFAPRYGRVSRALVRGRQVRCACPANDNLPARRADLFADARVQAALRLFAEHGLSASDRARAAAANANAAGDADHAAWWRDISRILGQRRS